jgi:hypothetical protein
MSWSWKRGLACKQQLTPEPERRSVFGIGYRTVPIYSSERTTGRAWESLPGLSRHVPVGDIWDIARDGAEDTGVRGARAYQR